MTKYTNFISFHKVLFVAGCVLLVQPVMTGLIVSTVASEGALHHTSPSILQAPYPSSRGFTLPAPQSQIVEPEALVKGAAPEYSPNQGQPVAPAMTKPSRKTIKSSPLSPSPRAGKTQHSKSIQVSKPTFSEAVITSKTFVLTQQAFELYARLDEGGGWPIMAKNIAMLKPGSSGSGVAVLKQRLAATHDLTADYLAGKDFDENIVEAVRHFQMRHGLAETGSMNAATLKAMNVPAGVRAQQLKASAARLAARPFSFTERYVAVNIPSAHVEAIENEKVVRRFTAIVGKPDRPSPQIETQITVINFNPTWTVPASLVSKDIIPQMQKDPSYLQKARIRLFDSANHEINAASIDWSGSEAKSYTFRQDSWAGNALGQLRIDMPNQEAVYMHDTPGKKLFQNNERFYSSGCVRVKGVNELAGWLLINNSVSQRPWTQEAVEMAMKDGKRRDVRLATPIPVIWTYLTGYATADGTVHFRDDIYGMDQLKS